MALKPIISGYDANDANSDTALIARSCELPLTPETIDSISPWRYAEPVAPIMAKGEKPSLETLSRYCQKAQGDVALVEGVGGILVPISEQYTVLDWMCALNWPVIVVSGSYLGAINHTLMTLEILKARPLKVAGLVISESADGPPLADTASLLESHLNAATTMVVIPRLQSQEALWKHMLPITEICHG